MSRPRGMDPKFKKRQAKFLSENPIVEGPIANGYGWGSNHSTKRISPSDRAMASQLARILPTATAESLRDPISPSTRRTVKGICDYCGDAGRHVDPEKRACHDIEACAERAEKWQ